MGEGLSNRSMVRELLAHVVFRGVIRERTVEPYLRLFTALARKRRVRGVLLDISSGGGASVPSTDFYLGVKRLDSVKPVVASIGGIGASGAYLAAVGARRVVAYPESEVGSIGVVYPHLAVRGLLAKLGIEVDLLHQGEHKDAYQGLRPLSDVERTKLLAVMSESYRSFIHVVARERKMTNDAVGSLATGEFWSGTDALRLGLVDLLGDRETALAELSRLTGVPVEKRVRIEPPKPWLARVLGGAMESAAGEIAVRLDERLSEWAEGFPPFRR